MSVFESVTTVVFQSIFYLKIYQNIFFIFKKLFLTSVYQNILKIQKILISNKEKNKKNNIFLKIFWKKKALIVLEYWKPGPLFQAVWTLNSEYFLKN